MYNVLRCGAQDGNGSNKSTISKTVYQAAKVLVAGRKEFFEGHDITALPVSAMIRRGCLYTLKEAQCFWQLLLPALSKIGRITPIFLSLLRTIKRLFLQYRNVKTASAVEVLLRNEEK